MNETEYKDWKDTVRLVLVRSGYTEAEATIVLKWWDGIKGRLERELVGDTVFDALYTVLNNRKDYNAYRDWTARILIYAPYILSEAKNEQTR